MPLAVCATPIGNLGDVTLRVLAELAEAELVLCEDTRRTRKLLTAHGIRAQLLQLPRAQRGRTDGAGPAPPRDGCEDRARQRRGPAGDQRSRRAARRGRPGGGNRRHGAAGGLGGGDSARRRRVSVRALSVPRLPPAWREGTRDAVPRAGELAARRDRLRVAAKASALRSPPSRQSFRTATSPSAGS